MLDTPDIIAISPHARWYAVQARPKQEARAAINLTSSGVTTFLPMIRHARRSGVRTLATAPLFPRYLFVQCDISRYAQSIRYTRGVAKVLGTSDGPIPLDDAIIASIKSRIGDDGYVQLSEQLEAGDQVEILAGPLKGFVGIFHSATTATQRVVLLLNAMHSQMRVVVDSIDVRRLPALPGR